MSEIVFLVQKDPEGGLMARALGEAIFTEADGVPQLSEEARDAVLCHFEDDEERPKIIRLHFVKAT